MKATPNLDFTHVKFEKTSFHHFVQMLKNVYQNLVTLINGNVGFGDGTNIDNISGNWINVVAPVAPNTDFTVNHNLNRLPVGYWVMQADRACDIYTGGVAATTTQLTLRASVASAVLRIFVICFLLSLFTFSVHAQNTNASGAVIDAGGQTWNNGTYTFNFVPAPRFNGVYRQNGTPFTPTSPTGSLSATGTFANVPVSDNNQITPSGTQWTITVCGQTGFICYTSPSITITGASQIITGSITPPAILVTCGLQTVAYQDSEVRCGVGGQYYNLTNQILRVCVVSTANVCSSWSAGGSGISPAVAGDGVVILDSSGKLGDFGQPPVGISSVSASDNFNRANENPIASPWIAAGAFPLPRLSSNTMTIASTAVQSDIALYSGITWPNDQFVQSTITQLKNSAGYIAWVLRCDAGGTNFYYVDLDASDPGFGGIGISTPLNAQKVVGGVGGLLHQFTYVTPQIGDTFKVEIIGNTISVFQNGTLVGTYIDNASPITSGSGGLFLQTGTNTTAITDLAMDNWVGGGVGTGGALAGKLASFSSLPSQIADSGITGVSGALGAVSVTASGLTPSRCVQTGTGGLLTTIGTTCAGAGGTVTSFSAGNLAPVFTTSVATATTTPALTFSLSNAAGNTVLGNCTSGSAAPSYCGIIGAMLPLPTTISTGAIFSKAAVANQFLTSVNLDGTIGQAAITAANLPATTSNCTGNDFAQGLNSGGTPVCASAANAQGVQVFSSTTLGADASISASTPTDVMTRTVTMPASGCPCRVLMSYSLYITTASSGVGYSAWVNDGSVNMAGTNIGQTNGSSGALAGLSYSGYTTVTYTNNTAVTFTLRTEGDHTYTVRKASQLAGSAPDSSFQVAVSTSN